MAYQDVNGPEYYRDYDPAQATILFQWWHQDGLTPEMLGPEYAEMVDYYRAWLKERGYLNG